MTKLSPAPLFYSFVRQPCFWRPRRALTVILGAAFVFSMWSLPATAESRQDTTLRVATTLPPLAWLVAQVAGPDVEVEHLMDPGDQPETFQPSDQRITAIARSAIFFRVGIPAENGSWLQALESSGRMRVVDLRRGIEMRKLAGHSHHHSDHGHHHHSASSAGSGHESPRGGLVDDPHIWLSPRRLEAMGWIVSRSLSTVDPNGADGYAKRATELGERLQKLDQDLRSRLKPVRNGAFFVFHPTWGYLAEDYGLRQIAVEIEGKEPTERELTRLMTQAQALGIGTIFVQPQIRSPVPRRLAKMLGARVESLDPLASDVSTNLRHVADRLAVAMQEAKTRP